jgi:hypothetical protein
VSTLHTVWTLPACGFREKVRRTNELALIGLAHRMPQRLAFRVLVDQGVRHIRSNEVVPDVTFCDVLKRSGDAR